MQIIADNLLHHLEHRYATKRNATTQGVPSEIWSALDQALAQTPLAYGLRPWKFLVISNPEIRRRLQAHAAPESWADENTHLIVFSNSAAIGDVNENWPFPPQDSLSEYWINDPQRPQYREWATSQVHGALNHFLMAAALRGIDASPLGGIEPAQLDAELGLTALGIQTIAVAAAEFRGEPVSAPRRKPKRRNSY